MCGPRLCNRVEDPRVGTILTGGSSPEALMGQQYGSVYFVTRRAPGLPWTPRLWHTWPPGDQDRPPGNTIWTPGPLGNKIMAASGRAQILNPKDYGAPIQIPGNPRAPRERCMPLSWGPGQVAVQSRNPFYGRLSGSLARLGFAACPLPHTCARRNHQGSQWGFVGPLMRPPSPLIKAKFGT